jgi:hypothetical protein
MPIYTYKYSEQYMGIPIMEILKDGEPFWEDLPGAKTHFRFGIEKAYMLLNCMPKIKEFNESAGGIGINVSQYRNENNIYNFQCNICRLYWNGHPYLKIEDCKTINFGLLKSESIIELEDEIKMFCDIYTSRFDRERYLT